MERHRSPCWVGLPGLFAYYYNKIPDGVINDRFKQELPSQEPGSLEIMGSPAGLHYDFKTPEYTTFQDIIPGKRESGRGLAHSYSFNRIEKPENYLSDDELIHMLADVVSKNGNLLLSLGPEADGAIPELQRQRFEALGKWLAVNGEAILDTRPWTRAEGTTEHRVPICFTQKEYHLFALILGLLTPPQVIIRDLTLQKQVTITILEGNKELTWQQVGPDVRIQFSVPPAPSPAYVLKITT